MAEEQKSPAELRAERYERLRWQWNDLSDQVRLGHLNTEISDVEGALQEAADTVAALRRRGYVYGRGWEEQVAALQDAWPAQEREAKRLLRSEARALQDLVGDIDQLTDRSTHSDSGLDRLENLLERFEARLESAESTVRAAYDMSQEKVDALEREFYTATSLLDALDDACFKLFPDERGVACCDAVWVSDAEEPEGRLFLTDGRLVFEQHEKKATKKVLFITTKSELIQEKLWEAPVGAVEEIATEDEKKGLLGLGRKQMLTLRFRERTRELPGDVTLRLKGTDNETWQGLIKRVQSGEIEAERYDAQAPAEAGGEAAAAPPEAAATPAAEIPSKCPSCGAQLPTVYKGMREIKCEYCDTVVRF